MKKILWSLAIIVTVFVIALIGGSFYMLDFSLAPDPNRIHWLPILTGWIPTRVIDSSLRNIQRVKSGLIVCEASVLCVTRL